jgi:hypothetical protein
MAGPGFNLNRFKAHVEANGILQNSKFMVRIPMPNGLEDSLASQDFTETARYLEYWCEATTLPGLGLNYHEVRRYGYGGIEQRPHAPQFQNLQLQFFSDAEGAIWTFFYNWTKLILNHDLSKGINNRNDIGASVYELAYKHEYAVDIEITLFNQVGDPVIITVIREAFPIDMPHLPLAWADTNTLQTLPITFSFFDWYKLEPPVQQADITK